MESTVWFQGLGQFLITNNLSFVTEWIVVVRYFLLSNLSYFVFIRIDLVPISVSIFTGLGYRCSLLQELKLDHTFRALLPILRSVLAPLLLLWIRKSPTHL